MKTFKTIFAGSFLFLVLCSNVLGQAIKDPATLPVYKANAPITVDGNLSEADWSTAAPHLMFKFNGTPSGLSYTPTNDSGLVVKPPYTDQSTCYVKFLRNGTNLYISLNSDDKQVCRFGDSWEGDGLFMKIKSSSGSDVELKLYYNLGGTDPAIHYEGPAYGSGAGYKKPGTVVNDSTNVDAGYSAELMIDLTGLGYTAATDSIQLMLVIFDPDNYSDGVGTWGPNGNFGKQWWGSEWGPVFRTLNLMSGTSQYDPASLPVYKANAPITVDGNLNESDWAVDVPHLMFKMNGTPSGMSYTPTNSGLVVKPPYTDQSTCYVKFLRNGTNLYISLNSDDKQVCRFGDSWEGDGLFMKIKSSSGSDVELKLYYNLGGTDPAIHYEGPAYGSGAGYKKPGTVVNDSTNVDAGYSAELMIDLTGLGYTAATDSIQLMLVIFDPDNYSDGVGTWGPNGNFGKQWWGSEWGPVFRTLNLLSGQVPVELTSFSAAFAADGVTLQWETSTETNNQGFEVLRSSDNQNFATVAFVKGHGTTTQKQNYSYIDNTDLTGSIFYRLKQLDFGGNYKYSNTVEVTRAISYELNQNYPNPFNPTTTITYSIPQNSFVTLKIYDILGSEVASLVNGEIEAGVHKLNFNAVGLNSGVYFYTIKAGNFSETKKLMLMK